MDTGSAVTQPKRTARGGSRHRAARFARLVLLAAMLGGTVPVLAAATTLQEAVAQVQHNTGGKVLSAQTLTIGKHKIYRIKVLTPDGQVKVVQVRADS